MSAASAGRPRERRRPGAAMGHERNERGRSPQDDGVTQLVRHDVAHPDGRQFHLYGRVDPATLAAIRNAPAANGYDVTHLHRRFDRLTGTWVLVSPARNVRPSATTSGDGAPACPLCPGGPELPGPFELAVFDNRFPSLAHDAPVPASTPTVPSDLIASSRGRCQVVVYTSDHITDLADLSLEQLAGVIAVWRERTAALWAAGHRYVMAFENHGNEVGATLPHLHGQIYALDHLPPAVVGKLDAHRHHRQRHRACLGCTLVDEDSASGRVVHENDHFVAAVPFAARWPYEVQIRAKAHGIGRLGDLDDEAAAGLVAAVADVVARYDGLWGFELPYLMAVQEAPGDDDGDWHLHVELLPPHRNVDRLKVRASVETTLGVFINDTTPEETAAALAAVAGRSGAVTIPTIATAR